MYVSPAPPSTTDFFFHLSIEESPSSDVCLPRSTLNCLFFFIPNPTENYIWAVVSISLQPRSLRISAVTHGDSWMSKVPQSL